MEYLAGKRRRHTKELFFTLLLLCPAIARGQDSQATSIEHVTVVNVVTGAEAKDQTVRIEGSRIVSIAPSRPEDGLHDAIDAHGQYLIPGLWDMHIHVNDGTELPLYVANGVTGVRIMAGERDTAALRTKLSKQTPSPDIYLASAMVDSPPSSLRGAIVITKPDDARRAVDQIKAGGADFISIFDAPRDAYFALVGEAKLQHIDFEGYLPNVVTAQEASAAGQRSIDRLSGLALACSSKQKALMAEMDRGRPFRDQLSLEAEGYSTIDPAKCFALLTQFRQNNTWQVPILNVLRLWSHLDDPKVTSDPRLAYICRKCRDDWTVRVQPYVRGSNSHFYDRDRTFFVAGESIVGLMQKVGVPIMAGTDAMSPYCFPGFSLHEELALMVQSGLTPLAALQTATINPAKFLSRNKQVGTVEPGKIANLVLLGADPLADIRNTTKIEAVWLEGKYFDKSALVDILNKAKEQ